MTLYHTIFSLSADSRKVGEVEFVGSRSSIEKAKKAIIIMDEEAFAGVLSQGGGGKGGASSA